MVGDKPGLTPGGLLLGAILQRAGFKEVNNVSRETLGGALCPGVLPCLGSSNPLSSVARHPRIGPVTLPLNIPELFKPFGISPESDDVERLRSYLGLLLKWNAKINLVGQANEAECVTRHFGETLFLTRYLDLNGRLLDIGSGAGFPGLALKITCPELEATLLEPVAKKRAFLKEVTRVCQFEHVTVLGDRLDEFSSRLAGNKFDYATSRGVGGFSQLIEKAAGCLKPSGLLCLWLGHDDASDLAGKLSPFEWQQPIQIPLSLRREILIGKLKPSP